MDLLPHRRSPSQQQPLILLWWCSTPTSMLLTARLGRGVPVLGRSLKRRTTSFPLNTLSTADSTLTLAQQDRRQ
jgi:hypothetical protein